jgi:hypothetical protein
MDAFSRLLASIGQSLGKGLGQVGQTELEQRQRLEALEAQRKANISGQLLQTFTQLLNTQGIQEVDPSGIQDIQQAVTDLALGKIDSPAVQKAIEVFPKVAASANKLNVYRELATKDVDALSRLIAYTDPKEAQALLGAIGLRGMYEGLRARGEILAEADKLGLQLTREQIENLAAQRKALLAKLEPEIRLLDAQLRLVGAQADEILAKLPLVLTRLQLEAQNLAVQIRKGEIEADKLDQILEAQIMKDLAQVGVSEAQAAVLREQIGLIREQIKSEVLRQAQIEAETEFTKAKTELAKAQAKEITDTLGPKIANLMVEAELKRAQIAGEQARTEEAKARAQAILAKLPLELEKLLLEIKKEQIELDKLPDYLDARLKQIFSQIALNEAETGLKTTEIDLIRQQIKNEILKQAKTEAETEKLKAETKEIEARTRWIEEQTEVLKGEFNLKLDKRNEEKFKEVLGFFYEYGVTDVDLIKSTLTSEFSPLKLSDEQAGLMAWRISGRIAQAATARNLQLADAVSKTSKELIAAAAALENPEAAQKFVISLLPDGVDEKVREEYGKLAYKVTATAIVNKIQEDTDALLKQPPPPKEREGDVLRPLYERAKKAFGAAYANGLVSQIKAYWAFQREAQGVKLEGERAEIRQKDANALYNRAMAATLPEKLKLDKEELGLKKEELELKREQVAQGWARLRLEELEAMAKATNNQNLIDFVNKFATSAKNVGAVAKNMLVQHLETLGHADCAGMVSGGDPENLAAMIAGIGGKCATTIRNVLDNKNDPVAVAFNTAVQIQAATIESIASALGINPQGQTGVTPGTTQPGGTGPTQPSGMRPGGTATPGSTTPTRPGSTNTNTQGRTLFSPPRTGGFESGVRQAYNTLFRQFGVKQPQDLVELGGMVFLFGNEAGPANNPLQVLKSSGVQMEKVKVKEGDKVVEKEKPVGPDFGFRAAIKADREGRGARQRALDIDSAIALGIAWIFPNEAWTPRMSADKIPEKYRKANESLLNEANLFKSEGGVVDITSVAAAYSARSLKRLGVEVVYTPQFTKLLRALAEHDLGTLTSGKIPSKKDDERAFVDKVMRMYGNRYQELRFDSREQLEEAARKLYWATRLSNIGNLAIGGVR